MKSEHNIRQDRPIVNATDNTSALFASAYTLAQAVCIASAQATTICTRQSVTLRKKYMAEWLLFTSGSTINRFGGYDKSGPTEGKRLKTNGFEKIGAGI